MKKNLSQSRVEHILEGPTEFLTSMVMFLINKFGYPDFTVEVYPENVIEVCKNYDFEILTLPDGKLQLKLKKKPDMFGNN